MDARCPLCSSLFQTDRTGIQPCPKCGQTVNVADVPPPRPSPPQPPADMPLGPGPGPVFESTPGPYSMSPPPPEGAPSADAPVGVPWERRGEVGFFKAYVDTWVQVVTAPTRFFSGAGPSRGLLDGLLFAWLTAALGSIPETGLRLLPGLGSGSRELMERMLENPAMDPAMRKVLELVSSGDSPAFVLGSAFAGVVFFPVLFFIYAGVFHVSALVCGAGSRGFEATARALGYAWAPMALAFIPCVAPLYFTVLLGLGLMHLHRASSGRATAAVVLPGVALSCCLCGFTALAMAFVMNAMNG
jgi:hypothetical protein